MTEWLSTQTYYIDQITVYAYEVIMMDALSLYSVSCQLYLSKARKQLKDSKFEDRTIEIIQSELEKEKI